MKVAVCGVDPALLIKSLSPRILQTLRQIPASQQGPTLFTSNVHFETLDADSLVRVVREVVNPHLLQPVSDDTLEELEEVVGRLTTWRNRAEHSEFYGDSDELLGLVQRQLALMHTLVAALAPDLLVKIRQWDNQAESRLRAIRDRVDAGWQVVLDYLSTRADVTLACNAMTISSEAGKDLSLHLSGANFLDSYVAALAPVPWHDATGMFHRLMQREPPSELGGLGLLGLPTGLPNDYSGALRNLGMIAVPSGPPLPTPFGSPSRGKVPTEDGSITIKRSAGELSLRMADARRRFVSVRVELLNWTIGLSAGVLDGLLEGELVSAKEAASPERARTLKVTGTIRLTTEGVADRASETLGFREGATLRWLEGFLHVSSAD